MSQVYFLPFSLYKTSKVTDDTCNSGKSGNFIVSGKVDILKTEGQKMVKLEF